jgi:hypothetical protein
MGLPFAIALIAAPKSATVERTLRPPLSLILVSASRICEGATSRGRLTSPAARSAASMRVAVAS